MATSEPAEAPLKKRKLANGGSASQSVCGHSSSDDEALAFNETVKTVLVPRSPDSTPSPPAMETQPTLLATLPITQSTHFPSSPHVHVTQPTQLVNNEATQKIVVPESSPPPELPSKKRPLAAPALNFIMPAGTHFKAPPQAARPRPAPQAPDLDDEGPRYQGGSSSSDESSFARADIKPTTFDKRPAKQDSMLSKTLDQDDDDAEAPSFQEITSAAYFKGNPGKKQRRLVSAQAVAVPRQTGPSRAMPVQDLRIDDIPDYTVREKVKKMISVFPNRSVKECKDALMQSRGVLENALEILYEKHVSIDLTKDDEADDLDSRSPTTTKRTVQGQRRKIHEKYSSTQAPASRNKQTLPPTPPVTKHKKGRLVQGRKHPAPSSPTSIGSPAAANSHAGEIEAARKSKAQVVNLSEEDVESDAEIYDSDAENRRDSKVLEFINTCSVKDLADIAMITEELASVIMEKRPSGGFTSLDKIRVISESEPARGGRNQKKKPFGDKVVTSCTDMLSSYEAVDDLVRECQKMGKPLTEAMQQWSVNIFGAAKDGETQLASLSLTSEESKLKLRDSGIGTPLTTPSPDARSDVRDKPRSKTSSTFSQQPTNMAPTFELKNFQIVGLNWLALLWEKEMSGILADEMGLGKTCQVISFLAHLLEKGERGPHLVIVPGSTIENWLREFQNFCPILSVEPYYGSQTDRPALQQSIIYNRDDINVVVTTYDIATKKEDNSFIRKELKPVACIFDEGHFLKNSQSQRYRQLMRIRARFRLLLTGTPLQNNLKELASLLGFIMPSLFNEKAGELESVFKHKAKTSADTHEALLSKQRIEKAKQMLTPFVLRRKKFQVLDAMPKKICRVELCNMTETQAKLYKKQLTELREARDARQNGSKPEKDPGNPMMLLRKGAIHPMLFRHLYTDKTIAAMADECLRQPEWRDQGKPDYILEDMQYMSDAELNRFCEEHPKSMSKFKLDEDAWMDSGKVQVLCSLLMKFKENGDRVLLFSQFVMVMDILEPVLESLQIAYSRLDGSTRIDERQDLIDQYNEDPSITVFMLSTKAGGSGINLATANKVIIFDSSFNPQDDIQAENRAHRVGQTREVEVIRLVTKGTIEQLIHKLGETKLALDEKVAGEESTEPTAADEATVVNKILDGEDLGGNELTEPEAVGGRKEAALDKTADGDNIGNEA